MDNRIEYDRTSHWGGRQASNYGTGRQMEAIERFRATDEMTNGTLGAPHFVTFYISHSISLIDRFDGF